MNGQTANEEVRLALETHLDVNPETGEIEGEERPLDNKDLPLIARQMRALKNRIETIESFRNQEAERIMSICTEKMIRLENQFIYFEELARRMVANTPKRRVEYPGLGVFRYRKMPDKVNTDGYDEMNDEQKLDVQMTDKGCFKRVVTVTPIKKEIMTRFKDDFQVAPAGFTIEVGGEKFEFKAE